MHESLVTLKLKSVVAGGQTFFSAIEHSMNLVVETMVKKQASAALLSMKDAEVVLVMNAMHLLQSLIPQCDACANSNELVRCVVKTLTIYRSLKEVLLLSVEVLSIITRYPCINTMWEMDVLSVLKNCTKSDDASFTRAACVILDCFSAEKSYADALVMNEVPEVVLVLMTKNEEDHVVIHHCVHIIGNLLHSVSIAAALLSDIIAVVTRVVRANSCEDALLIDVFAMFKNAATNEADYASLLSSQSVVSTIVTLMGVHMKNTPVLADCQHGADEQPHPAGDEGGHGHAGDGAEDPQGERGCTGVRDQGAEQPCSEPVHDVQLGVRRDRGPRAGCDHGAA